MLARGSLSASRLPWGFLRVHFGSPTHYAVTIQVRKVLSARGLPANARSRAASGECPCLRAEERYERMRQKAAAPSDILKHPPSSAVTSPSRGSRSVAFWPTGTEVVISGSRLSLVCNRETERPRRVAPLQFPKLYRFANASGFLLSSVG